MDFAEVRAYLDAECQFPADQKTIIKTIGDVRLETTTAETETVESVLERIDQTTYKSADDVRIMLFGTVGEDYIGRKYYDDRDGVTPRTRIRSPVSI